MTIKSAPYYWVVCDGCKDRSPREDSEIVAWSDNGTAVDDALNWDWLEYKYPPGPVTTETQLIHLCPNCIPHDKHGDSWEDLPDPKELTR